MPTSRSDRWEEFGQLLLEQLDALYGFAMILTKSQQEAEDLVQETYLRALQGSERFARGSNLKAWLFTILRNIWINQQRARQGREFLDLEKAVVVHLGFSQERPDVWFERRLQQDQVRRAIESLPVAYREVVILRDIEGFSYRKIADIIGCPIGTVMSRLGRARASLRQILSKHVKLNW